MKKLIVLSGLPGSGKTTWANKYLKSHKNTYVLCLDKIRKDITGTLNDFTKQDKVWSLVNEKIIELSKLDNVTIIIDALNHKNKFRIDYLKSYPNFDNYTLVILNKKIDDLIYFNKKRSPNKWVKNIDIESLSKEFEFPNYEVMKKYNKVIFINDYA